MRVAYSTASEMLDWALATMERKPDFIIGDPDNPYMRRWWVVPRNEGCNVYLHEILRDDDDRALHDHPWDNTSMLLQGSYVEHTASGKTLREKGSVISRLAADAHRLEVVPGEPVISLFMTGPKVREWGFLCPERWVPWREFTAGENGELIGKGCA